MQDRYDPRPVELTVWEKINFVFRRVCKLAVRKMWLELHQTDWKPILRKVGMLFALLVTVYVFSVWARGTSHALFIPYTPYDTQHLIHRDIAKAADVFFTQHPTEMCISSLELSIEKDRPFFHIILRSNMHHSYDGHFYNLLNPEYVTSSNDLSRLHRPHHVHHNRHKKHTQSKETEIPNPVSKLMAPAPPLPRPTSTSSYGHRQSSVAADGTTTPSEDTSYLVRAIAHAVTKLPGPINEGNVGTAGGGDSRTSSSIVSDGDVQWSSGLVPSKDVRTSSEWSLRREEKTYCEYVYYRKGNYVMQFIRWLWPGFALHPEKLPTQKIYRKKKIHIRYLDLATTKPFERTFEAEHAFCIQHYLDVFNQIWEC